MESGEQYQVPKVILTAGPWTNDILHKSNLSQLPITITNEQVTYFLPKSNSKIDFSMTGNMPVFLQLDGPTFYGIPHIPHGHPGVKIASHITGTELAHPTHGRSFGLDSALLAEVVKCVLPRFPGLETNPGKIVRCLYSVTADRKFIIGDHVDDKRFLVAGGFCGAGFKHGPVVGESLCKMVLGEKVLFDVERFSVGRFFSGETKAKL